MNMFSGTTNFNMLDRIVEKVLQQFFDRIATNPFGNNTIDLKAELTQIFDETISMYNYGKDVSSQTIRINTIRHSDGKIIQKDVKCFQAIEHAINTGVAAAPYRMMVGQGRNFNTILQ